MKRNMLALIAVLLVVVTAVCGCGKTITTTQTEVQTVTGPVTTQTVNVTGPVTTITQATTVPGPATTTIQTTTATITATVTGPTTTTTLTKTAVPAQGIMYISSTTPASPAILHFNDWVTVKVSYVITDPAGAQMWAIPMTNGQQTPNSGYGASGMLTTGGGTASLSFGIASGVVKVDQIHLLMRNSTQSTILFEAYITVDFTYGQ